MGLSPWKSADEWHRNIGRMFRTTAVALILSEITGVLATLIDGIVTSRFLGVDVYSGISLLKPFTSIVLLLAGFLSTGCNIYCSRLVGGGRKEEANEAFNLSFFLALAVGILVILACIALPEGILTISGVNMNKYPELNGHMFDYLHGYMIGVPLLMVIQVMGPVMVMDNGKGIFAVSSVALCITDIAGDLLNAFVFHGGAFGMGLATSVAYAVQLLFLLPHFMKRSCFFRLGVKNIRFRGLKEIAKHGSPAFVKKLAGALRDIAINYLNIMVALTAAAIAARGIQSDLFMFVFCIPTGLGRTLITMVGVFFSGNDMKGLTRLYSYAISFGFMVSLAVAVIIFAVAPLLTAIYTGDPEVASLAVFSIRWMSVALVFDTMIVLTQHYFQGIGDLKKSNLLSFSERFFVPVACALVMGLLFGTKGILASTAVSKMLLVLIMYIGNMINCKGLPRKWKDIMFLPEGFGGAEADNMYAEIRTVDDVIDTSRETQEFCLAHGVGRKEAMLLGLFVEEMALNVIENASKKNIRDVQVDFRLFISDGKVCFSMMDLSENFDPTLFYELHREDRPEAHIGIRMVTNMATEMRYFSTFGSNNLVISLE